MSVSPTCRRAGAVFIVFILSGTFAAAQSTSRVSGQVINANTQKPVKAAVVLIEELKRETVTDADGRYTVDNVPAGVYHLVVAAPGFTMQRAEVTVAAAPLVVDVAVPCAHQDSPGAPVPGRTSVVRRRAACRASLPVCPRALGVRS